MPNFERPPVSKQESSEELQRRAERKFEVDDLKLSTDQVKERYGPEADKKQILKQLIEAGRGVEIAMKLNKLNIDPREPAKLLVEKGYATPLTSSIEDGDKDARAAYKDIYLPDAIKRGEKPMTFDEYAKKVLQGPYDEELAKMLIKKDKGSTVAKYLYQFEVAKPEEIASMLIEAGEGREVINNLKKFEGIDYNGLARKLFEKGMDIEITVHLDEFKDLDRDILLALLEKAGNNKGDRKKVISYAKERNMDLGVEF